MPCPSNGLVNCWEAGLAMHDHTLQSGLITWVTFIFIFCLGVRSP